MRRQGHVEDADVSRGGWRGRGRSRVVLASSTDQLPEPIPVRRRVDRHPVGVDCRALRYQVSLSTIRALWRLFSDLKEAFPGRVSFVVPFDVHLNARTEHRLEGG